MIAQARVPTHPGAILAQDFLARLAISEVQLADHVGLPVEHVRGLVSGSCGITAPIAWLLAQALRTTPELWMNLQLQHDLSSSRPAREIQPLVPPL